MKSNTLDREQFPDANLGAATTRSRRTEQTTESGPQLTGGRLLAQNTMWNLLGSGAPMVVAVLCIPILVRELGEDRFGVITLTWALIGYASLFDLGLGRALTQLVAKKLGQGQGKDIPTLVWTSLALMLLLGVCVTACVFIGAPWLVTRGLKVQGMLHDETVQAFRVLGLSIPFVITNAGLRGLLEAHQEFRLISALRAPLGVFTFAGPVAVLAFSKGLVAIVAVLVLGRILTWAAHLFFCLKLFPSLRDPVKWDRRVVRPLLTFGGWMTVTNVVSPILVTVDRFMIGALVSMTAVAYYATPYEVVTKFLVLPGALMVVMFPAFSTGYANDRRHTTKLFIRSMKVLFLTLFPLMLLSVALAHDGLKLWMGEEFASHSYRVFQCLAIGVFVNALALGAYTFLQGIGRPDLTGILHFTELPFYLAALILLTKRYGIEGAAVAWTSRVCIDALFMFLMVRRFLAVEVMSQLRMFLFSIVGLLALAFAAVPHGVISKGIFLIITLLAFLFITWFRVLSPDERKVTQHLI